METEANRKSNRGTEPVRFESWHTHYIGKVKGLSQEKLARLTDVVNNMIIKIEAVENQNPTPNTLKRIAKALKVSVEELIK